MHFLFKRLPFGRTIVSSTEILSRFPLGTGKFSIASALLGKLCTRLNRRKVNIFKNSIHKAQMLLGLPRNMMLCQHVVIAGNTEPDGAILLIGQLRFLNRIEVQVNDIVEGANHSLRDFLQLFLIFHINISKTKRCQVTNHKIAGLYGADNDLITLFRNDLSLQNLRFLHILRNFRTEVGAINDALMLIRIHAVYRVSIKGKRCAGLHRGL